MEDIKLFASPMDRRELLIPQHQSPDPKILKVFWFLGLVSGGHHTHLTVFIIPHFRGKQDRSYAHGIIEL